MGERVPVRPGEVVSRAVGKGTYGGHRGSVRPRLRRRKTASRGLASTANSAPATAAPSCSGFASFSTVTVIALWFQGWDNAYDGVLTRLFQSFAVGGAR